MANLYMCSLIISAFYKLELNNTKIIQEIIGYEKKKTKKSIRV